MLYAGGDLAKLLRCYSRDYPAGRMKRRGRHTIAILAVSTTFVACMRMIPYSPKLSVPIETIHQRIHKVCLEPLRINVRIDDVESRRQSFEGQMEEQLRRAGFEVAPGEALEEVRRRVRAEEGGFYNPHTGRRDEDRYRLIQRRELDEVHRVLGCDGVLTAAIVAVTAPFGKGQIRWDGYSAGYGGEYQGWTGALSLHVRLYDLSGDEMLFSAGGIQPLSSVRRGSFESYFEHADPSDLLANEYTNLRAIHFALQPLISR